MKSVCLVLLIAFAPAHGLRRAAARLAAAGYGAAVADNIKAECGLPQSQAEAVLKQLAEVEVPAQAATSDAIPATGRFLDLRIEAAISGGNAFIGHRKHVTTSARLFEDRRGDRPDHAVARLVGGLRRRLQGLVQRAAPLRQRAGQGHRRLGQEPAGEVIRSTLLERPPPSLTMMRPWRAKPLRSQTSPSFCTHSGSHWAAS